MTWVNARKRRQARQYRAALEFDKIMAAVEAALPRCKRCNRKLSSKTSIARGYGVTCLLAQWDEDHGVGTGEYCE